MTALNMLGLSMLALQAGLVWLTMGSQPAALLAVAVAAVGCRMPLGRQWASRWFYFTDPAVILIYAILWWLHFRDAEPRTYQYGVNTTLTIVLCILMLQAIRFHRGVPAGPGALFPFLGILSIGFAAGVNLSAGRDFTFFAIGSMLYGMLAALYFAHQSPCGGPGRGVYWKLKTGLLTVCLLLSLGLASGSVWALNNSDRLLDQLSPDRFIGQWMLRSYGPGLGQRIALGNDYTAQLGVLSLFDGRQANAVALEIIADEAPGYLRGQVYATNKGDSWEALASGGEAITEASRAAPVEGEATLSRPWRGDPPEGYEPSNPRDNLFWIAPGGDLARSMTIFPARNIQRAMFTPESTGWVAMEVDSLIVNAAGIVESRENLWGLPYRAFAVQPPDPEPLLEFERSLYTQLPQNIASKIIDLAEKICAGQDGPVEKARAVADHFTLNYRYSSTFDRTQYRDSLEFFLFSTPPLPSAHCEYFAMGSTLLLRAAGVPARYVTGVVGWERHPYGDYWVVRNRDAHAWCEAWAPEIGWFVVESTPSQGLPGAESSKSVSPVRDLWGVVAFTARRWLSSTWRAVERLTIATIGGVLPESLVLLESSWPYFLIAFAALGLVVEWGRRRLRQQRALLAESSRQSEQERRLLHQLVLMDRYVQKRYRITRPGHWTPHAFAREIEAVPSDDGSRTHLAGWYRSWAEARYRLATDVTRIDALEKAMLTLQGRLRTPAR